MQTCSISRAGLDDLEEVADLFDQYRQFYLQAPDVAKARDYLRARLTQQQSVIFVARDASGQALGFCQLYPSFCSVAAAPIFVLYDLFVAPAGRRRGTGRTLLQQAAAFGKEQGAAFLMLSTAKDNFNAQALYESLGWQRDDIYYVYNLGLDE